MMAFDEMCLTPVEEMVIGRHLDVSRGLVSQWERGKSGLAAYR